MMPLPLFRTTTYDKFYLASSFIESLIMGTILMSYCSMLLIAPQFILTDDREIELFTGNTPDPITDFGIGIPCLYELKQGDQRITLNTYDFSSSQHTFIWYFVGLYARRGCFLACDIAK